MVYIGTKKVKGVFEQNIDYKSCWASSMEYIQ